MPITAQAAGVKAGAIADFAGSTAPAGWLICDGSAISRTLYSALFSYCGTSHGVGDGTTTFNIPDCRGEFRRGLDNGRGVDTGRVIGSAQSFATMPQTGSVTGGFAGDHGFYRNNDTDYRGIFSTSGALGNRAQGTAGTGSRSTLNISIGTAGATETRPRNKAFLTCIKF